MTEPQDLRTRTAGQKIIRVAAFFGGCYIVLHFTTVLVTIWVDGLSWGMNAWILDIAGYLAGGFFAYQCWLSSIQSPLNFRRQNRWIFIWALITISVRLVDTFMLFGVLTWTEVYIAPTGPTLWANIISEVIVGTAFCALALIGSGLLLFRDCKPA